MQTPSSSGLEFAFSHLGTIYELAGPEIHTPASIARGREEALGVPVHPVEMDPREWGEQVDLDRARKEMLLRMFEYYAEHGLWGNPRVLAGLLGRKPTTLRKFLNRHLRDAESR